MVKALDEDVVLVEGCKGTMRLVAASRVALSEAKERTRVKLQRAEMSVAKSLRAVLLKKRHSYEERKRRLRRYFSKRSPRRGASRRGPSRSDVKKKKTRDKKEKGGTERGAKRGNSWEQKDRREGQMLICRIKSESLARLMVRTQILVLQNGG